MRELATKGTKTQKGKAKNRREEKCLRGSGSLSYRFSRMKSSIICLMCFNSSGSVTPCLDFGYNIN